MAPSVIVGYWNMRGFAQSIRNLLEYTGTEYEDKRYDFDMTDPSDLAKLRGKWPADLAGSPLIVGGHGEEAMEFPNLPYYIETRTDGTKLKVSQSLSILKHIGRQNGLTVEGEDEVARMEQYEQQVMDLRTAVGGYCYNDPTITQRYPNYPEDIKSEALIQWDKILGGRKWIMGDKLTYVDFLLWECIDWHVLIKHDILNGLSNLESFQQRFRDLPEINAYFNSSRYQSWPLFGPYAKKFGYFR